MIKGYIQSTIKFILKNRDALFITVIIHFFLFVILDQMEMAFIPEKKDKIIDIIFPEEIFKEEKEENNDEKNNGELSEEKYKQTLQRQMTNRTSSLDQFTEDIRNQYNEKLENDQSLKEAREMGDIFGKDVNKRDPYGEIENKENDFHSDIKKTSTFTGKSNVYFTLKGRQSIKIYNPIYKCPKGGLIVIDIEVNGFGEVQEAKYNREKSSSFDVCLIETAIEYAKKSLFNTYHEQEIQEGSIIFNFL